MSGVIGWEEPPPSRRSPTVHDWAAIADALRSNPGTWALVAVCPSMQIAASTARYVRESHYKPLRGDVYEAASRLVDGESRVYARYIGEKPP